MYSLGESVMFAPLEINVSGENFTQGKAMNQRDGNNAKIAAVEKIDQQVWHRVGNFDVLLCGGTLSTVPGTRG